MANQILAGAVVQAGMVIAGVDANNPPVTGSAPAPSLGDPFPHAGDIKATGAPYPFYAHSAEGNDWLTYGVFTDQPYDNFRGKPYIVPSDTPRGAIHFLRYDLDNEMLYAYVSASDMGTTLSELGFGSGWGLFYSWWTYGGNNSGAAPVANGASNTRLLKRPMTEAEFDALNFYWDADGGVEGQGSWKVDPVIVSPTQPVPATSVSDASFYSVASSDGQAIDIWSGTEGRVNGGEWVSYGLGEGWFGEVSNRPNMIEDGTWTGGAIHYLRYDPIGKRIWAFVSYENNPGFVGTLEQNGFTYGNDGFFNGLNNMTDFAPFPSGYFGTMTKSTAQYEPEDLAGLGITWNGTSWQAPQPSSSVTSWVVVGSIGDDDQGNNSGTAYVYSASDLSAAPTKLLPAANSGGDRFGGAVAATANTIVIGAYADDEPDYNVGSAYVFNANDLSATPTKLTSPNPTMTGEFGNAVAVTDNHVIIGAYKEHGPGASDDGKVYVYNANDLTAAPVVLSGTGSYDEFGISVAADSDIIVVGAHLDDEPNPTAPGGMAYDAGAVYVYNANDLTATPTRLVVPDPVRYEHLGESISINDNQIVVGTQSGNSAGPSTGTFFVFDRNDLSAEPTEITAFDAASNDRFGYSVASSNDKIAAGAWNESDGDGAVYVYDATDLTAAPTKLTPVSGTNGNLGWNVDIDGNYLVVGAKDGGTGGQVFVYDLSDLSGAPVELSRSNPENGDFFGWSVALG